MPIRLVFGWRAPAIRVKRCSASVSQIQSLPTLLLLRKGRVQVRQVGPVPPDAALHWVRSALEDDAG